MAAEVFDFSEVARMAEARRAKKRPGQKMDARFIPKGKTETRSTGPRSGVSVQFYCPTSVLEAFDIWYKAQGIASRKEALVWLMDDAAAKNRKPPALRFEESDE